MQIAVKDIQLWDANYRVGDVDMIANSIQRFGYNRSVSLWRDNIVIAGNHTVKALKQLEAQQVDIPKNVMVIDGDWVIDVSDVSHLDDKEAEAYAIADNRASDSATNDDEQLASLLSQIKAHDETLLEDTGWNGQELDELLSSITPQIEGDAPEAQIDRAEELNETWQVKSGDLWIIPSKHGGEHRLLCGDSTNEDDVKRLMGGDLADLVCTDPPYGVSYADKNKYLNVIAPANRIQAEIVNDHMSVDDMSSLWECVFKIGYTISHNSASYYVTSPQGGELMMMMMMMIQKAGWQLKHCLIWVKNNHVLGRSDYNYKHEPILYGWKESHKFYGNGQFKTSIWTVNKPHQSKEHPTMKPVELFSECLLNSTIQNQTVYDPFGGSGTTMVACEQLARQCRMIEIEPKYCAVILERMAGMGLEPVLDK